jgi:hypothetical protein
MRSRCAGGERRDLAPELGSAVTDLFTVALARHGRGRV